jgi:hypothetical protein
MEEMLQLWGAIIWDHRGLVLPITCFIEKPFRNYTRVTADSLGTVFQGCSQKFLRKEGMNFFRVDIEYGGRL